MLAGLGKAWQSFVSYIVLLKLSFLNCCGNGKLKMEEVLVSHC